jgi:hypothetical protein
MSCERYHDQINQLIEGSLEPDARQALETHLRTCDACAALADDLRGIRTLAASLDRLEPPDAVWRRVAKQTVDASGPRRVWFAGVRRSLLVPLATAACLVLAVGIVYIFKRPAPAPSASRPAAPAQQVEPADRTALAGSIEDELRQAAQHYENAIQGLEKLAQDQQAVDPQVAATLQKNLQLIDQAITESRAAVARDPGSEPAQRGLFEALRTKIAFLQETIALVNEMRKGNQAEAARIAEGLKKS